MWVLFAVCSAIGLGFYDVMKKVSVRDNNVPIVLLLNTLFGTLLMSPVIITGLAQGYYGMENSVLGHAQMMLKTVIVLSSWLMGYFAIKHLPLTIQGPINATRPVLVLVGALIIFGERLNWIQWCGIAMGFLSLYMISRIGGGEGFSFKHSRWIWLAIGATLLGAISALYDKYLLRYYKPLEVQAWYSLYQLILMSLIVLWLTRKNNGSVPFKWRWSIPCISLFLTGADIAYFYSLSLPDAMISVVSMIRRGSVLVSFMYGVLVLHETRNLRGKVTDLLILLVSLLLLIIGSSIN